MDTYNAFFNFLVRPSNSESNKLPLKLVLSEIVLLFLLKLALSFVAVLIINTLTNIENVGINVLKGSWSLLKLLLIGGLIMPVSEEIVFRLPLKFNPYFVLLSSLLLSYGLITKLYFKVSFFSLENTFFYRILISLSIGFILFLITRKSKSIFEYLWKKCFKWILYGSIIVFALLHIGNYKLSNLDYLWIPLIIFPQLVSASVYSFIRIRHGFIFSCLLHIFNNTLVIII